MRNRSISKTAIILLSYIVYRSEYSLPMDFISTENNNDNNDTRIKIVSDILNTFTNNIKM